MNTLRAVAVPEGHKLTITKDTKPSKQPNYVRVGHGAGKNKHGIAAIPLFREMLNMSKAAMTVVVWLEEAMVWNPYDERVEFVIKLIPETASGKRLLKAGFKELQEKGLVRRVKRSHYMLNPNAMIVDYEKQMEEWNKLDKKETI